VSLTWPTEVLFMLRRLSLITPTNVASPIPLPIKEDDPQRWMASNLSLQRDHPHTRAHLLFRSYIGDVSYHFYTDGDANGATHTASIHSLTNMA
jgi:hypothetical protein